MERNEHDTGLECLVILARFHGLHADPAQINHAYAINTKASTSELLKIARDIKLKARCIKTNIKDRVGFWQLHNKSNSKCSKKTINKNTLGCIKKIDKLPLPLILKLNNNEFVILAQKDLDKDGYLILDPANNGPERQSVEYIKNNWSGEAILLSSKVSVLKEQIFGLKWFIPSIWKYRKALKDVLIASLCIQILGLGTPIVMQVIIDKVLVHKGITTLNALAIGLLIIILFEWLLGMSRNILFANTTNKIDVVLGAKIFKHLFSLPLRYFENRRVGDTISRVRQVEHIREFLTGAPLSSVLDLMFVAVYILVMFFYTSTLTLIFMGFIPLFIILSAVVNPMYRSRLDEKFQFGAETNSYLVENVSGVQTVKTFALEPQTQKKWEELLSKYVQSGFKLAKLSGIAGSTGQTIQRISDVFILWFGAVMVIEGHLSVGALIAFRMLSGRVSGPILRIVQMWQNFQQVGVSIRKLGDIFKSKSEPAMDASKTQLPAMEDIVHVSKVAGAHDFIVDFPDTYNTQVGERGSALSGGQRQRVAIARALLTDPGILIFDEATSSLDYESEKIIQDNLREISKGRTVIIIAHRLSTLRDTDKIISMDRGEIVEYGSHEHLMELKGIYHSLYTQQFG